MSQVTVLDSARPAHDHAIMHFYPAFSWPAMGTLVAELSFVGVLHLLPRLGKTGAAISAACTRAPLLDCIVAALTWVPWLAAGLAAGWVGVAGSLLGQAEALLLWTTIHELTHRQAVRGPRIVKVLNRVVGRWRNYAALWVTLVALPGFWLIRLHELLAYPFLVGLLKFPPYQQSEWVNVSRQKFEGLVGHDLVWCLYCDWMTGVYSLGAEMLRNVESFWCPIRFYDGKKCENCRTDFPDIDHGWVPATGTMKDVTDVLDEKYADGHRTWFGHPARLTVRGQDIVEAPGTASNSMDLERARG